MLKLLLICKDQICSNHYTYEKLQLDKETVSSITPSGLCLICFKFTLNANLPLSMSKYLWKIKNKTTPANQTKRKTLTLNKLVVTLQIDH